MGQGGAPCPKPEKGYYKRLKAGRKRERSKVVKQVRPKIFDRAGNVCECCRIRPAESMSEYKPRSVGGKISEDNSDALCGSGTTGCHGHVQRHNIIRSVDEHGQKTFTAVREVARRWMAGEE